MSTDGVLEQLLRVVRLSSAQRELVFEAALTVAEAGDHDLLVGHIQAALSHEELARRINALWQSRADSQYVPEMPPLDHELDGELSSLYTLIEEQSKGRRVTRETRERGAELLAGLMPNGVVAVTRQPYPDQARDARDIVKRLRGDYASHVEYFGLTRKVAELEELVTEYSDAVSRSPASIDSATNKATQERAHLYLLEVVAAILGMYFDGDNPEHTAARGQVTRVLFEQMDKARALTKARRRRNSDDAAGDDSASDDAAGDVPA